MTHTLLLADDSPTIQRVIELTFADEDIAVVSVGDGDQAIASLDKAPPDIVLADVDMPGRSGFDVARYVKATPALAHIPVLLLTGAFDPVDPQAAADAGSSGVLTKPFEPRLVVRRVRELLDALPTRKPAAPIQSPRILEMPRIVERREVVEPVDDTESIGEALNAAASPPPGPQRHEPAASGDPRAQDEEEDAPDFADEVVRDATPDEPESISHVEPRVVIPMEFGRDRRPPAGPKSDADIESYFEELDQAFATLANVDREPMPAFDYLIRPPIEVATETPVSPVSPSEPVSPALHIPDPSPTVRPPEPPPADVLPPMPTRAPISLEPAPAAVLPSSRPPVSVSLADAFGALLAAERSAGPVALPSRPTGAAPVTVTDELVERIADLVTERVKAHVADHATERLAERVMEQATARVMERMSSDSFRATVETIVSSNAERLVREEIERIKSNIT